MSMKKDLQGGQKHFLRWPLYLTVIWAAVTAVIFYLDYRAGIIAAAGTVAYLVTAFLLYRRQKNDIVRDMVAFASCFLSCEQEQLDVLGVPYAVMETTGRLI